MRQQASADHRQGVWGRRAKLSAGHPRARVSYLAKSMGCRANRLLTINVSRSFACAARSTEAREAALSSHHFGLSQPGDLVRTEAELGKHLVGLLAELRRPRRHLARRSRQRDRLTDQADVTVFGVRHILRDA